jgi:hypothetical protein
VVFGWDAGLAFVTARRAKLFAAGRRQAELRPAGDAPRPADEGTADEEAEEAEAEKAEPERVRES